MGEGVCEEWEGNICGQFSWNHPKRLQETSNSIQGIHKTETSYYRNQVPYWILTAVEYK
jgi:hypothetical protein